jgi:hypothetical protein
LAGNRTGILRDDVVAEARALRDVVVIGAQTLRA